MNKLPLNVKAKLSVMRLVIALMPVLLMILPVAIIPADASLLRGALIASPKDGPSRHPTRERPKGFFSRLAQVLVGQETDIALQPINSKLNDINGIAHYQPTNELLLSVSRLVGQPQNFEVVATDGTRRNFSKLSGLSDKTAFACVRDSLWGFKPGEIFTGTNLPGAIARISSNGSAIQNPWAVLPAESQLSDAGFYVDRTGVFSGNLIVVTRQGNVWQTPSSAKPSLLTSLNTPLDGVTTVPNDPARYGPWAGKILVGTPQQGGLYTVDTQGHTEFYHLGISPTDIDLIPANENFFGVDFRGMLWGAPASKFSGMIGDILVAQEFPGILWHLRWTGADFQVKKIAQVTRWKQITFSPAGMGEIDTQATNNIAVTRHAPSLNGYGRVEGSLWQLTGEDVALTGTATITQDLLVPGTPKVRIIGNPTFNGVVQGTGSPLPSHYLVTLSGNASLNHLLTRTDPFEMMPVAMPLPPTGTRDVVLTHLGQSVGDFSTLRDLTLSGQAGAVAVPPGTYGAFTASSNTAFVFGIQGSTQPSVYNLKGLSLTDESQLRLAGPVVITITDQVTTDDSGVMGAALNPSWLSLKVAAPPDLPKENVPKVRISGGSVLYGVVRAPSSTINIEDNGRLNGNVFCNRLIVNGKGILQVTVGNQPPEVNAGPDQLINAPMNMVNLNGAVSDDGLPNGTLIITWSKVSGPGTVAFGDPSQPATTATFSAPGLYILRLAASDSQLTASDDVTIAINQAPVVSAGSDQTITLPDSATLNGTVTDDGLPVGATLIIAWSKVSGPGTVTFTNPNQAATGASFSAPGIYDLRLTAGDTQLTSHSDVMVTVNSGSPQQLMVNAGANQMITLPAGATLNGSVSGAPPGTTVITAWTTVSGPGTPIFGAASALSTSVIFNVSGDYKLRLSASDGPLSGSADVLITVNSDPTPPPSDPMMTASPVDRTVTTTIGSATQFLYSGANPIQTGVAPGTINPVRAAVLRGRVLDKDGTPLPLVKVTVLGHAEFGQTLSRADGKFDMAVNGGGPLTVKYEKPGFIPVQRQMDVPWQDYSMYPDVVMIGYDLQVTFVDLSANLPIQVARGSVMTDADGTRQSTLLFKQGTAATMQLPDNTTQALTTLHVRATEFTVGATGDAAMPGKLPPTSQYTYAAEYSLDEAVALNAVAITFNQPVIQYNENFLNFPVGISVPSGTYDRVNGAWIASASGRVVKVLSVAGGQATLDVDGAGGAATDSEYAALGISVAERQTLATLYAAGQSLWRVPIDHFSGWDSNWGWGPPPTAAPPPPAPPPPDT